MGTTVEIAGSAGVPEAESRAHVEGWDSQAHVSIIVAAEVHFGIRFRTAEFDELKNVGDLVRLIVRVQLATALVFDLGADPILRVIVDVDDCAVHAHMLLSI